MKRILAQIRKEMIQLLRDPISVSLAVVLPVALMVIFGVALSLTVSNIPIAVQDLDRSPESRAYIETFQASLTFRLQALAPQQSPESALLRGQVRGVIIVPPRFGRDIARGRAGKVQMLIDATDANTANVLRGSVAALTRAFASQRSASVQTAPISALVRLWYNPGREDRKFIVPGAMVVCLSLLPPLLASLAASRETERGTILQVYVSGIRAGEYLLGKIGAFFLVAALDWLILFCLAVAAFGLRLTGNPLPFLIGSLLFLFCMIAYGVMVGVRLSDQASAIQVMQLGSFVLSFLLSGFLFPVENIPVGIRWVSSVVPARYYIEIVRDAFLRGGGWEAIGKNIAVLTLLSVIFFAAGWRQMRKMQVNA